MEKVQNPEDFKKEEGSPSSFGSQIGSLLFLVEIFFINFLARIILSPLMPLVEKDLNIGHDEAGSLFFLISLGYCVGLFTTGFISFRFNHRRTIVLSSIMVGGALMIISMGENLWLIRFVLILLGVGAGLYLPSGIATVTELVRPVHWGKAIALHEFAPNLSFMSAPFISEFLLRLLSWRGVLSLLGITSIVSGAIFFFFGKGGFFLGEAPNFKILRSILRQPSFWIMMVLFTLATGAALGVYSIIPLYLVSERGIERTWANTILGLSRISTLAIVLLSGWVADHLGLRKTLKIVFITTGIMTIMLGVVPRSWIILIIFLQPMLAICFFPAGFAAISRMDSPGMKNVALSLTVTAGVLLGGGAIPAGMGLMGKMESFSTGFIILGGLVLVGAILVRSLKFSNTPL